MWTIVNTDLSIPSFSQVSKSGTTVEILSTLSIVEKFLKNKYKDKVIVENRTDAFEAFGFAILGHMTLLNEPSNVPVVTNAKRRVVLGNITNPPYKE